MKRSEIRILPQYFDRYINLVEDINIADAFNQHKHFVKKETENDLEKLGDQTYENGKWTIKDILQHIIDTERIFAYRALRFARNDSSALIGFDQDTYSQNTNTNNQTFHQLIKEFEVVRASSILLYESFSNDMLQLEGISNNIKISVLSLGFTMIGHQLHHTKVIQERYLPLLQSPNN